MDNDAVRTALQARIDQLKELLCEARTGLGISHGQFQHLFENAPISIWLEDFSRLMTWFGELRANGVSSITDYFQENPEEIRRASGLVFITDINQAGLDLIDIADKCSVVGSFERLFQEHTRQAFLDEAALLWEGRTRFNFESNGRSASGKAYRYRLDVRVPGETGQPDYSRVVVTIQDVTARDEAEKALRESEARFHGIVDNLGLGVALINSRHEVIFANSPMRDKLPGLQDNTGGKCYTALPEPRQSPCQPCPVSEALADGETHHLEISRGEEPNARHFSLTAIPYFDSDGEPVAIEVMEDITARKRMEAELIRAKEAAEAATRAKSRFLANMSHELRTPLTAVLGLSELALSTSLDGEQRAYIEMIEESSRHLLGILGDILDFSRIEADKLEFFPADFNLRRCLETTLRMFKASALQKGLELRLDINPSVPEFVSGDAGRLRQVLVNLLGNALKFTSDGWVALRAFPGGRWGEIVFQVEDTGMGIPPSRQEVVFDMFTQADGSYARRHQGSGLGLTLTKRIVELMGGDISFESVEGLGTSFSVRLPLGEAQAPSAPDPGGNEEKELPRLRVLLAEDNPVNQLVARRFLERLGHEVVTAENGSIALENLARRDFDIVLMDIQMPVLDGISAAKAIRAGEHGVLDPRIPIVALTAHAFRDEHEAILEAGMDCHVTKPFERPRLVAAMAQALRARGRIE